MNYATRARDWRLCMIGCIGAGVVVAGGVSLMDF